MADLSYQPIQLQNGSYTAKQDRLFLESILCGEGVFGPSDFKVTTAGISLTLTIASGKAIVRGDTTSNQGVYQITDLTGTSVTLSTASASNPRLDQIVLRVYDKTEAGGLYDKATVEVVTGTATSGATLDNRSGAATLPDSALLLADVLVGVSDTAITSGEIRDRRKFISPGAIPQIVTSTTLPAVSFSGNGIVHASQQTLSHASHDTKQISMLQYLPRRIEGATRVKFRLAHSATALAGNWIVSICDASGRPIVSTSSTALTGSLSTSALQSGTITATTFDAGLYYVFFGLDTSTGAADCLGYNPYNAFAPNVAFHATSGGVTVPTTILGLTDTSTSTPAVVSALPALPQIALVVE